MKKSYSKIFQRKMLKPEQKVMKNFGKYHPLPQYILDFIHCVDTKELSTQRLKNMIEKQDNLSAGILNILNSDSFNFDKPIRTVESAILQMGLSPINELAFTLLIADNMNRKKFITDLKKFWEHSFGCGYIGAFISKRLSYSDSGQVFLAGLLHDIGKILLYQNFPIDFMRVLNHIKEKKVSFYQAEKIILGVTHCDMGFWLGNKWNLPEEILDVIQHHHKISKAQKSETMTSIINLADHLVKTHYTGFETLDGLQNSYEDLEEQNSWKILVEQNLPNPIVNLDEFFDEIEIKLDKIPLIIEKIYDVIET